MALESWKFGAKRILWVSATHDLMQDALRDMRDLCGADLPNPERPGLPIFNSKALPAGKSWNRLSHQELLRAWCVQERARARARAREQRARARASA